MTLTVLHLGPLRVAETKPTGRKHSKQRTGFALRFAKRHASGLHFAENWAVVVPVGCTHKFLHVD